MVSAFQNWRFQCCRQGTRKTSKKYEDVELQALLDEDDSQTQKQLAELLTLVNKLFPIAYKRDGKDSESRQMGAT